MWTPAPATIYVHRHWRAGGTERRLPFVIDPATLPQPEALKDQAYTGNAVEPGVTIAGLVEGRDYTVRYEDNVEPGTATAVVTGIGNYAGSYTLHFTILEEEPEPTPEPTPESQPKDGPSRPSSIVTDENWRPEEYSRQALWMRTDGAEEAVRVLLIDACPVLNADGTPVLRGDGSPLYSCATCTSPPR